ASEALVVVVVFHGAHEGVLTHGVDLAQVKNDVDRRQDVERRLDHWGGASGKGPHGHEQGRQGGGDRVDEGHVPVAGGRGQVDAVADVVPGDGCCFRVPGGVARGVAGSSLGAVFGQFSQPPQQE